MSKLIYPTSCKLALLDSLFPSEFFKERTVFTEEVTSAVMTLAVNLILGNKKIVAGVHKALTSRNFKEFDANPGDGGCQLRTIALRTLSHIDLKEESESLSETCKKIKEALIARRSNPKLQGTLPISFIHAQFEGVNISKNLEFLIHCHFLKTLRAPYTTLETGVVMTKSEISKLEHLSPKIALVDHYLRAKIIENSQQKVSLLSMERLREEALFITTLHPIDQELLSSMIHEKNTHFLTLEDGYMPKAYGSLFYSSKALLCRLKEEGSLICMKAIAKDLSASFSIYLRAPSKEEAFCVVDETCIPMMDKETDVAVFESVFMQDKATTIELLKEKNFEELVLINAALESPYERGSCLEDIKEPAAFAEISSYREMGKSVKTLFLIDHIFFNILEHVR